MMEPVGRAPRLQTQDPPGRQPNGSAPFQHPTRDRRFLQTARHPYRSLRAVSQSHEKRSPCDSGAGGEIWVFVGAVDGEVESATGVYLFAEECEEGEDRGEWTRGGFRD